MEAWCLDESEYQTPAIREENSTSSATPVGPNASGEGLPYAPENFPNPGDKWGWKVGKRKTRSGYWADRYLSLPASLQKTSAFPSKVMVQKYITENFPTADIDSFFASFSWRIPAPDSYEISVKNNHGKKLGVAEISNSESPVVAGGCKAGNKMCRLRLKARAFSLPAMDCDICCNETCEALDTRDDIEKILNVGLCILRGSEQMRAKSLLNRIGTILTKLRSGIDLEDIWNLEDGIPTINGGGSHFENGNTITGMGTSNHQEPMNFAPHSELSQTPSTKKRDRGSIYITADHDSVSLKLEDEIDEALRALKESQELEYRTAEQKLYAHKDFLLSLYQILDRERAELARPTSAPSGDPDSVTLGNVLSTVNQIRHEEIKMRQMMQVSKGFGRTSRMCVKNHFGLQIDE
ncbi:hypothetical protein QJS10_CPB19g01192 [Acorus calamus]|uniref:Uncharacterized protein n=1 Tax=Acorus calamus TaxID=4465 RepID=A0AAV9CGB1_ACOCL|nr:hypothetical protein QJS10_CPB19g01192 [Acorus calamus]